MYQEKEKPKLTIFLASPRGFCAGVERAIEIVKLALDKFGAPVYVRHEIVHNKRVLEDLRALGAIFVDELEEVPNDRPVIFSAHGVQKSVQEEAKTRNMLYIDATCPLVLKVHIEASKQYNDGNHIIMIGHKGHAEVIGTMGQLPKNAISLVERIEDIEILKISNPNNLSYITQTTLSVKDAEKIIKALKAKYPNIKAPDKKDICYATTNRQVAVSEIAKKCEVLIVVGSKNSSNSNRLVEVARSNGCSKSFLIDCVDDINWQDLKLVNSIGITAGASAPEKLVKEIIESAKKYFDVNIENIVLAEENIKFNIPKILRA